MIRIPKTWSSAISVLSSMSEWKITLSLSLSLSHIYIGEPEIFFKQLLLAIASHQCYNLSQIPQKQVPCALGMTIGKKLTHPLGQTYKL